MNLVHTMHADFDPEGLREYIQSKNTSGVAEARQLVPDIQLMIHQIVIEVLKQEYDDQWWREGVPQNIRPEVAARREESNDDGEVESFFELINYKSIAEKNWELLGPFLAIGDAKSKKFQLGWFSKLHGIRLRVAHPERGPVSPAEVEFLHSIRDHFDAATYNLHANTD